MQQSSVITIAIALVAVAVVGVGAYILLQPPVDLLTNAGFEATHISPNADGFQDITTLRYTLARNATVTVFLENLQGDRFYFRENEPRTPGAYTAQFSGVVGGFLLPDEPIDGIIERRLIPNDTYTWTIEATNSEETQRSSGTITIADADSMLPAMPLFEISPSIFTPNQDGLDDRVTVNVYLEKSANLSVFLQAQNGQRYYLPEREITRAPGEPGNHEFDWDAGVDQNMEPPADGVYAVYAVAQDDEGQRITRQSEVTIENGGLPQVELVAQTTGTGVYFASEPYDERYFSSEGTPGTLVDLPEGIMSESMSLSMPQGDLLVFKVTVYNYGTTPVRTAGPFPGTVYDFGQTFASLKEFEQAGAWRVGIRCDTSMSDFPWRWALAPLDQLEVVYDGQDDVTYYYLPSGARAEVWGAIRMTEIEQANNPQDCWAGLIHEQVATVQQRFGAREVRLTPTQDDTTP